MKKAAIMSAAAVVTMFVQLVGIGPAAAVEPDDTTANPQQVQGYGCDQSGIGTKNAYAICRNQTDQARYAHFHVDCWHLGDSDTDQTKWVGPWGSISFHHYCWSWAQSIEAFFY
jgi:hypothetical protein